MQRFFLTLTLVIIVLLLQENTFASGPLSWKVDYNAQGWIARTIDPAGRITKYNYTPSDGNPLEHITVIPPEGDPVTWELDRDGRLISMNDALGKVTYSYDERGRLESVQREGSPAIRYKYDAADRIAELRVGDFYSLAWTYDFLGRISALDTPAGRIRYDYQTGQNTVIRTLPNGIETQKHYNVNGKLQRIVHVEPGRKVIAQWSYQYRPDGLIARITEWTPKGEREIDYTYDDVQRLSEVDDFAQGKTVFHYDKLGNRVAKIVNGQEHDISIYDWSGRMAQRSGQPCHYDAASNLKDYGGMVLPKFEFDTMSSLKTVNRDDVKVEYLYDGDGYLVSRIAQGKQTRYLPDPTSDIWRPMLVVNPDGSNTFFVWDGDTLLMSISGNSVQYFLDDYLGSVRAVANQKGAIVSRFDYSPFGLPQEPSREEGLQPGFAGLFYEPVASVYLVKARTYDPQTGRFLQLDPQLRMPTGSQKDLSWYTYCGNDPVNYVDSNGAEPREVHNFHIWSNERNVYAFPFNRLENYYSHSVEGNQVQFPPFPYLLFRDRPNDFSMRSMTMESLNLKKGSERDWVIRQVIHYATGNCKNDIYCADQIVNHWRYVALESAKSGRIPKQDRLSYPGKVNPTYDEWQAVENYFTARKQVETGVAHPEFNGAQNTKAGLIAANKVATQIPLWQISHLIGENSPLQGFGHNVLNPDVFIDLGKPNVQKLYSIADAIFSGSAWHGQTNKTIEWQYKGIEDGLKTLGISNYHVKSNLPRLLPNTQFRGTMQWHYENAFLHNGAKITGDFSIEMYKRSMDSGYEKRTITRSNYSESYNGAAVSKAVEEYNRTGVYDPEKWYRKLEHDQNSGTAAGVDAIDSGCVGDECGGGGSPPGPGAHSATGINQQRLLESKNLADTIIKQMEIARDVIQKHDLSGGPGRSAGIVPIGMSSSEGNAAAIEYYNRIHASPSTVGGVYLGGAGKTIDGLGHISGVSIDQNNNLVLLGREGADIDLPPLRLDDVVTVFRSVYIYGEGPTVTIDPNPENPEKSAMIIRHGEATEDTYVGWILYQADRLMKSYGQGIDNKTEKKVVSHVAGYDDILDKIYFGGVEPRKAQKEGIWERFWIVPSEVNRYDGPRRELTLFDVPLKVKTQKMKWEKDKLVDDQKGKSSPGATAFSSWFTDNYSGIAQEQFLTPPPETGITEQVPVFAELQKIALLTAVAEKLRDQGVAMPFWMRDYEVRKVPFERFTPGMEVTWKRQQGNTVRTARIFGGVALSPDDKTVKTYHAVTDVPKAPETIRTQMANQAKLADSLERAVEDATSPALEPLTVTPVGKENRSFRAVSVPGSETIALGPCLLDEADLVVPVEGGRDIQLIRSFNSFFNPKGPWGSGWALDLPRLVETRIPVSREGGKVTYSVSFEMISPLNSLYASIRNGRPDDDGPFQDFSEAQPSFLKQVTTRVLHLKDGQEWHFTKQGNLVATKEGPQVTVYERGPNGRLTRIVAVLGGQMAGTITLEYNQDGQLVKAVGESFSGGKSEPVGIVYSYDDGGRLAGVTSDDGTVGYAYDGTKVSAVTWREKSDKEALTLRSFQYDSRGRVLSEKNGDVTTVHSITTEGESVVASSQVKQNGGSEKGATTTTVQYDQRMRPTEAIAADGSRTHWVYPEAGGVEITVSTSDGESVKMTESPDGSKRTILEEGVPPITANFDTAGRVTSLTEGDKTLLAQEWRPDGQLYRATAAGQGATLDYDENGLLSSIMLHPAKTGEKLSEWQETKFDRKGRPVAISDCTGLKVSLGYDESGLLASAVQKTQEGNLGYNLIRDEQGRVRTLQSSWGDTQYSYDKDGTLERIVSAYGDKSASMDLDEGRVQAFTDFDGGRTTFAYRENDPAEGMPQTITCANGLALNYDYSKDGDLSTVKVGTDRVVRLGYDKQGRVNSYAWEPANP